MKRRVNRIERNSEHPIRAKVAVADQTRQRRLILTLAILTTVFVALFLLNQASAQTSSKITSQTTVEKMPAALAGTIPPPSGQIAFLNNGDVFIMNVDGSNQTLACQVGNATGRLSWSPDNKEIAFTRRGDVQINKPDGLGGKHRVYDIFKVIVDSVGFNSSFWNQVTTDNGGRYPEWSTDGERILYTQDLNANLVNAEYPNYQTAICDPFGGSQSYLRKDYQQVEFMAVNPTAGPNGAVAYVAHFEQQLQGLIIQYPGEELTSLPEVRKVGRQFKLAIAPSWSPDGKWIAYVENDLSKARIYLISPDKKQHYLLFAPPAGVTPNTVPPSWSADSKWLTFSTSDGRIWICDITGNQAKEISRPGANISPAWSR
jgi:Tol biopolymer transport system component